MAKTDESSLRVDLCLDNCEALCEARSAHSAASIWAQCMMDQSFRPVLKEYGSEYVKDLMPRHAMTDEDVLVVLRGMRSEHRASSFSAAIVPLTEMLSSQTVSEVTHAAGALWALANAFANLPAIVAAGIVPRLAHLLESPREREAELAVRALSTVLRDWHAWSAARALAIVPRLVKLLDSSKPQTVQFATRALQSLSSLSEDRTVIVAHGAIPHLVRLLVYSDHNVVEAAAAALSAIGRDDPHRILMERAGVVPVLVRLLQSSRGYEAEAAAWLVSALAETASIQQALVDAGALPLLMSLLTSVGRPHDAHAGVGALREFASLGECQSSLVAAGVVPLLVRLLDDPVVETTREVPDWGVIPLAPRVPNPRFQGDELAAAAVLLGQLACSVEFLPQVVEAGAIPPLLSLLGSDKGEAAECAAHAMSSFAAHPGMAELLIQQGILPRLFSLSVSAKLGELSRARQALAIIATQIQAPDPSLESFLHCVEESTLVANCSTVVSLARGYLRQTLVDKHSFDPTACEDDAESLPAIDVITDCLDTLQEVPELSPEFDQAFASVRHLLASARVVEEADHACTGRRLRVWPLSVDAQCASGLREWFPQLGDEFDGTDAWFERAKRFDLRLGLLGWRRAFVEFTACS
jgi:hypothetical protein